MNSWHRFKEACAEQPKWKELRKLLLSLGGEEVVPRHEGQLADYFSALELG